MERREELRMEEQQPQILRNLTGNGVGITIANRFSINAGCSAAVYDIIGDGLPSNGTGRLQLLYMGADEGVVIQVLFITSEESEEDPTYRTATLLSFAPAFTSLYGTERLMAQPLFRRDGSSEHAFTITSFLRTSLADLNECTVTDEPVTKDLHNTALAISMLKGAMESAAASFAPCAVPACRFLAYDSEREKIFKARAILDDAFDEGISIKDLARRVAMNECYLKKGFKMLVGSTVHEYQSNLRIEAARRLLSTGQPVTTVAETLGYSSISHFSTAFKKATGLKPCELLR